MPTLSLFPIRVAIGRFKDSAGVERDVLMTPEFARAMSSLLERVGGPSGMGSEDLELLISEAQISAPPQDTNDQQLPSIAPPEMASVLAEVAALRKQVQFLLQAIERPTQKATADLEQLVFASATASPQRIDWERPGRIGFRKANSGKFTTVTASGAIKSGVTGAAGQIQLARAADGASGTVMTFVGNDIQIDSPPGDVVLLRGSVERIRATATGGTVTGAMTVTTGFGCNAAAPQVAAASGGAVVATAATNVSPFGFATAAQADGIRVLLNNIRAALVANGIMS